MKLKEIHDAYCEKQRILEEEAVRLKNEIKQKELERRTQIEKGIIEKLKPNFIKEYQSEIKAIEEAGIQIVYDAEWLYTSELFVNFKKGDLRTYIVLDNGKEEIRFFKKTHYDYISSREELLSLIYQYFFCQ